jgi:putative DNA primase/helicase
MPFKLRATGQGRASVDVGEVKRALAVLADPEYGVQIQSLPFGSWRIVRGNDLDAAVRAAEELSDGKGVYYSLNPCDAKRTEPIRATAMLCRRNMLVDLDVDKLGDNNATDAEHDQAREAGGRVMDWLTVQGWPLPVVIDPGNGWHLVYRLDLPNDRLTHSLIKRTLTAIGDRFDTEQIKVDRKVFNSNRIAKLPGTMARKGPMTDDRPHRMARLMFVPDNIHIVDVERLQQVAGLVKEPDAERPPVIPERRPLSPFKLVGRGDERARTNAYAKKALRYEALRLRLSTPGTRNTTANDAAFRCGTMVGAQWLLAQEVEAELLLAAHQCGLPTGEAADVIRRALEAGRENPRPALAPNVGVNGKPAAPKRDDKPGADKPGDHKPLTVLASEIRPQSVQWLWPGRVPKNFITIFAGQTDMGKSFVTLDMIARMTTGGEIPFCKGECFDVGSALVISEDPPEYMLVPRLIELGADLGRVRFMSWEAMSEYFLGNATFLDDAVNEVPDCRLVVIDPPTNFLGDVNENRNSEIRQTLKNVVLWCKDRDLACVLIMHVNKQGGKGTTAINRVVGSVAWLSSARIAHVFAPSDHSQERRLFVPLKNNLGPKSHALAFELTPTEHLAKVAWIEEIQTTADDAMLNEPKRVRRDIQAKDWLVERFREKLSWPSDELFRAGKAANLSRNAIFEAKDLLDLPRARVITHENGDKEWVWWVPPDWPPLAPTAEQLTQTENAPGQLGQLGQLDEEAF